MTPVCAAIPRDKDAQTVCRTDAFAPAYRDANCPGYKQSKSADCFQIALPPAEKMSGSKNSALATRAHARKSLIEADLV